MTVWIDRYRQLERYTRRNKQTKYIYACSLCYRVDSQTVYKSRTWLSVCVWLRVV